MSPAARPAPLSASILAVGTEVVEGQIVDRNSAWLAGESIRLGFSVASHMCVPDERSAIRRALDDLRAESATVFVSGGLGPTSDDFTREIIAESFSLPLEFSDEAWHVVQEKLNARGVRVGESQKRQCYFPQGAMRLANPVGTAEAFCLFLGPGSFGQTRLIALPGPPSEIGAVFDAGLRARLADVVPLTARVDLRIWRCLGRGEAELAELAESALAGSALAVGYRAHAPYVEVKVWVPRSVAGAKQVYLDALERVLAPWLVNREGEDAMNSFLITFGLYGSAAIAGRSLRVVDAATGGLLAERLTDWLRANKQFEGPPNIVLETVLRSAPEIVSARGFAIAPPAAAGSENANELVLTVAQQPSSGGGGEPKAWLASLFLGKKQIMLESVSPPLYLCPGFGARSEVYL